MWAPLGEVWRRFWDALQTNVGASGAPLGEIWRRFWGALQIGVAFLGRLLARSGGASGAPCKPMWAPLGAS